MTLNTEGMTDEENRLAMLVYGGLCDLSTVRHKQRKLREARENIDTEIRRLAVTESDIRRDNAPLLPELAAIEKRLGRKVIE